MDQNKCDKQCQKYCWSDYMNDKNSIFGKIIFTYVLTMITVANWTVISINDTYSSSLLRENFYFWSKGIDCISMLSRSIFLLIILSYLQCYFKDPGYVSAEAPETFQENLKQVCKKCDSWKPPRAHHCSKCRKCVFKMERHCFFINNCVGVRNIKSYALFLASFIAMIILFMINSNLGYALMVSRNPEILGQFSFLLRLSLNAFLCVQGCFFFRYVLELFEETISGILKNRTAIEKKKGTYAANIRKSRALTKVFGRYYLLYFVPMFHKGDNNLLEASYPSKLTADLEIAPGIPLEKYQL